MRISTLIYLTLNEYVLADSQEPQLFSSTADTKTAATGATGSDSPSEQTQQITTYAQDGAALNVSVPNPAQRQGDWGAGETRTHDVKDILSRVTDIAQLEWTPSVPPVSRSYQPVPPNTTFDPNSDSRLLEFKVPDDIFAKDANKSEKVNLFAYMRAKTIVKVTLNAQAFVCGKLWLCFNPYADSIDSRRSRIHQHLAGITSLQGVELDVGSRVEAQLEIPFCSPYESYDLVRNLGSQGVFQLWVLSPLRSGDNQSATLTVQSWFEDVDITVPTLATSRFGLTRRIQNARKLLQKYEAQGAEEEVKRKTGLSTIVNAVGAAAGALTSVPLIGGIAKPVSAIANIVGKGLSFLGFSKPTTDEHTALFENTPGRGYTHIEGVSNSHNVGMIQNNETVPGPNTFVTKDDEMDIAKICKNPYMATQFQWSTDDKPDDLLVKIPVTMCWAEVENWNNRKTIFGGPAAFVASMFGAYRADANYRLSRVQTPNHTGRLRVLFVPNVGPEFDPLQHREDWGHVQSWIVDGNTDTDQNITVEYTSAVPFKRARFREHNGGFVEDDVVGFVYVYVFNELRAPQLASQTIDVQVWVNYDNVELAYPMQRFAVVDPVNRAEDPVRVEAQGLEVDVPMDGGKAREQGLDPNPILDMRKDTAKTILVSTYGEKVHNLRQFLHRFTLLETVEDFGTRKYDSNFAPDPAVNDDSLEILNIRDYIGWMYRFRFGGTRLLFAPRKLDPTGRWTAALTTLVDKDESPHGGAYDHTGLSRGSCIQYTGLNPFLQVQMPYYTNSRNRVISRNDNGIYSPGLQVSYVGNGQTTVDVLVAGDDSFSYGWRLGPPPFTRVVNITDGA